MVAGLFFFIIDYDEFENARLIKIGCGLIHNSTSNRDIPLKKNCI